MVNKQRRMERDCPKMTGAMKMQKKETGEEKDGWKRRKETVVSLCENNWKLPSPSLP